MSSKLDDQEITIDPAKAAGESSLPSAPDLLGDSPHVPNQYEILQRVNKGGMGVIFKARHRYTKSPLAIKFLHSEHSRDPEALKRFQFEAKTAMDLKHTNITRVHDFGVNEDQIPYFVMDWVDGIPLAKKIERDGDLNIEEALRITVQAAEALSYAHSQKIIHRDLKPENLMLTRDPDGRTSIRILDFGIAKTLATGDSPEIQSLTQTGAIIGSPLYMSPEQGLGRATDERSDIYSLGCVLYYALVGHPPFMGATSVETICKHINDPVPRLQSEYKVFPEGLQTIIMKALEKEPADRYQSMDELITDLELFKSGQLIPVKQQAVQHRTFENTLRVAAMFIAGFLISYLIMMLMKILIK